MLTHEWHGGGNVYIRPHANMAKGDVLEGHTHNFDHVSIVFTGAVRVDAVLTDGREVSAEFKAPAHCLIKAEVVHKITALEDGTNFWCVYAHRTPQADVVQEYPGWPEAYS